MFAFWKTPVGNSFSPLLKRMSLTLSEDEIRPRGGTEHLMSLGTNQKKQQGWIPIPPHLGTIKVCLDVCLSELPHLHQVLSVHYIVHVCL